MAEKSGPPSRDLGADTGDISDYLFEGAPDPVGIEHEGRPDPNPLAVPRAVQPRTTSSIGITAQAWPKSLPDRTEVQALLVGEGEAREELASVTERVIRELTDTERSALADRHSAPWAAVFAEAAVERYRLAAARATLPEDEAEIVLDAFEEILKSASDTLPKLVLSDVPDAVQRDAEFVKGAIARDSVPLSEVASRLARGRKKPKPRTQSIAPSVEPAQKRRGMHPMLSSAFILALAAGGLFHGIRWMEANRTPPPPAAEVGAIMKKADFDKLDPSEVAGAGTPFDLGNGEVVFLPEPPQ